MSSVSSPTSAGGGGGGGNVIDTLESTLGAGSNTGTASGILIDIGDVIALSSGAFVRWSSNATAGGLPDLLVGRSGVGKLAVYNPITKLGIAFGGQIGQPTIEFGSPDLYFRGTDVGFVGLGGLYQTVQLNAGAANVSLIDGGVARGSRLAVNDNSNLQNFSIEDNHNGFRISSASGLGTASNCMLFWSSVPQNTSANVKWASDVDLGLSRSGVSTLVVCNPATSGPANMRAHTYLGGVVTLSDASIDFADGAVQQIAITGTTSFTTTTSSLSANTARSCQIYVSGNSPSATTVSFPAPWRWIGAKPSTLTASGEALLALTARGATESTIVACWTVLGDGS